MAMNTMPYEYELEVNRCQGDSADSTCCVWMSTGNFSSFTRNESQTEEDDSAGKQSSQGSMVHREWILRPLLWGPIACRPVMQGAAG